MDPIYVTHDAIRSKPSTVAGSLILERIKGQDEQYRYRFYQRLLLDIAEDLQRRLHKFGDERMRPPGDTRLGALPHARLFWEVDPIITEGRTANYLVVRNTQPRILVPGYIRKRKDIEFTMPIMIGAEMKSFLYGSSPRSGQPIKPGAYHGEPEMVSGEGEGFNPMARALAWHAGSGERILRARSRGIPYSHPQKVNARRIFYNIIRTSIRKSFLKRLKKGGSDGLR